MKNRALSILVSRSYLIKIRVLNQYSDSIFIKFPMKKYDMDGTYYSDVIDPNMSKKVKINVRATHIRDAYRLKHITICNSKNDTLQKIRFTWGLLIWLGEELHLPITDSIQKHSVLWTKHEEKYCRDYILAQILYNLNEYGKCLNKIEKMNGVENVAKEHKRFKEDITGFRKFGAAHLGFLASFKLEKKDLARAFYDKMLGLYPHAVGNLKINDSEFTRYKFELDID